MRASELYSSTLFALILASACGGDGPIYSGDPSQSCAQICAERSLTCDEEHAWSTTIFGTTNRGGGERRYRSSSETLAEYFDCDEIPPETVDFGDETLVGGDNYKCACVDGPPLPDGGLEDGGAPDTAPSPGEYPGDISAVTSCEDVCVDQGLVCDARYRWSSFLGPGSPGGTQSTYRAADGSTETDTIGCYEPPAATLSSGMPAVERELSSYMCACTVDPGGILNDVEQRIENNGVYQGTFTLSEPATVTYTIDDGFILTANNWTVAIVPSASVDAYLGGEATDVYGEFMGAGSTTATVELAADDYTLVLRCRNGSDSCRFHTLVTID